MPGLKDAISKAAKRQLVQRAIRSAGAGLTAGLGLGCLVLVADRFFRLDLTPLLYVALAAAGLLLGLVAAVLRRPDAQAIALRIDRAFHLKDRLSTAVALHATVPAFRQDPAFAEWVQRDADRLAGRIDVRPVTPLHISGIWGGALALAFALTAGILFLPARAESSPGPAAPGGAALRQEERDEVVRTVEQAVTELREDPDLSGAAAEDLDALEDLAAQLATADADAPSDPAAVRDETAAKLTDVADRLARQAERDAAASEELLRRFNELSPPEAPLSAEEFSEALRRGDFGDAAELLERLFDDSQAMTEEERHAAAEHLREISDQLGERSEDVADQSERLAQLEQALRDQGLTDQQASELMESSRHRDTESVRQELEQENVDPEVADQLARDLQQLQQRREQLEQAEQDSRDLSEALRDAADAVERGERPEEPARGEEQGDPQRDLTPEGARGQPDDAQSRQERSAEAAEGEQEQTPGEERRSQQDPDSQQGAEQQVEPREGEARQAESREGQEEQRTESREGQPQEAPSSEAEGEEAEQQEEGGTSEAQQRREERQGAEEGGGEPQEAPSPDPQAPPDAQPPGGEGADQQPSTPDQQPPGTPGQEQIARESEGGQSESMLREETGEGTPGQSPQQPAGREGEEGQDAAGATGEQQQDAPRPDAQRLLREYERRRGSAAKQRETAERFQRMARELSEGMSEEEREQWAEQWQRERGGDRGRDRGIGDEPAPTVAGDTTASAPPAFDDVDLTGEELADETLIEWLTDERPEAPEGMQRSEAATSRIRRAQDAAERAVNESTIPPRYHDFIRRYFDRLDETVGAASGESKATGPGSADGES